MSSAGEVVRRLLCPRVCDRRCGEWQDCQDAADLGRAVLSALGLAASMPAGLVCLLVEHANRAERLAAALRPYAEAGDLGAAAALGWPVDNFGAATMLAPHGNER